MLFMKHLGWVIVPTLLMIPPALMFYGFVYLPIKSLTANLRNHGSRHTHSKR